MEQCGMPATIQHCYVCETPSNISASNTCTTSEREIVSLDPGYLSLSKLWRNRTGSYIHSLSHSLTHSLTLSLSFSLSHPFTHSLSLSLSHSLTHPLSLTHSLTRSLTLILTTNNSIVLVITTHTHTTHYHLRGAWVWEHVVLEARGLTIMSM